MEHVKTMFVFAGKLQAYNRLLKEQPATEEECFGEDEIVINTVKFNDGHFMDIKICGVQFETPETSLPYAEAVLFNKEGYEVSCSDCEDEYEGEWTLHDGDDAYVCNVAVYDPNAALSELKRILVEYGTERQLTDFLGYRLSSFMLKKDELVKRVNEVASQMPDDCIKHYESEYLTIVS